MLRKASFFEPPTGSKDRCWGMYINLFSGHRGAATVARPPWSGHRGAAGDPENGDVA